MYNIFITENDAKISAVEILQGERGLRGMSTLQNME